MVEEGLRHRIRRSFTRHRMDLIEPPYEPRPGGRDGILTVAGYWMKFLRIGHLLIVPTFGMKGDERALRTLSHAYPGIVVEAVECRELAEEGGSLHCVTWHAQLCT
jgi:agmatine/peptidylarginine deiminase